MCQLEQLRGGGGRGLGSLFERKTDPSRIRKGQIKSEGEREKSKRCVGGRGHGVETKYESSGKSYHRTGFSRLSTLTVH